MKIAMEWRAYQANTDTDLWLRIREWGCRPLLLLSVHDCNSLSVTLSLSRGNRGKGSGRRLVLGPTPPYESPLLEPTKLPEVTVTPNQTFIDL